MNNNRAKSFCHLDGEVCLEELWTLIQYVGAHRKQSYYIHTNCNPTAVLRLDPNVLLHEHCTTDNPGCRSVSIAAVKHPELAAVNT